jgi:hypothetical protein
LVRVIISLHLALFFLLCGIIFLAQHYVFLIHVALPFWGCLDFDGLREYHVGEGGTEFLVEVLGAQDELVVAGQLLEGQGWLVQEEPSGEVPVEED